MQDTKPIIKLYLVEKEKIAALTKTYGSKYSKNDVLNLAESFRKPLLKSRIEVYDKDGYITSCSFLYKVMESLTQPKPVLLSFVIMMMEDARNLRSYFDSLSEEKILAYKMMLHNGSCRLSEIRKLLGLPEQNSKQWYYLSDSIKVDLMFVEYFYHDYDERYYPVYYICIDHRYRELLYDILLPEERVLVTVDEVPDDLHTGSFETSTISYMPAIQAFMEQGVLVMGNYKFTAASVKKGVRQLGIEEFFTQSDVPQPMPTMRGSIMLQSMGSVCGFKKMKSLKSNMPEMRLKMMHQLVADDIEVLYPILMGHFSGLRPSYYDDFYGGKILEHLHKAIAEWKVGVWMEVQSIISRFFLTTAAAGYLSFVHSFTFDKLAIYNKFNVREIRVTRDMLSRHLGVPFLKGLLFYMAAWGMVDIAYSAPSSSDVSPYDTLRYVRLTQLGAYVMGMTDEYERQTSNEDIVYFELDSDRLIIRSLSDNPYEKLLVDTCMPIGNKRYRMTAETFLAHCSDKDDVKGKITFFKKYISGDLPKIWTDFFDSLVKRCNPLTAVSTSDYFIYKIPSDNLPLIHQMTNDPVLRQLVVKAESFLILVPVANKTKFENRLKSLGYMM